MGIDVPMLEQLREAHTRSPALMPLGETLGFRVERLEKGFAVVAMEAGERHANVLGATHGGVIFALADTAMGLAHLGMLAEGEAGTTVEVKINFLRPVWRTKLRAEAKTVHSGSTLSFLECSVHDGEQRLIARAVATLMRLTEAAGQGRKTVYNTEPQAFSNQTARPNPGEGGNGPPDPERSVASTMMSRGRSAFSIRKATEGDAPGVLACLSAAFEPYRESYTPEAYLATVLTPETLAARLATMCLFVAEAERGEIVGTLTCHVINGDEGHLRGMAVLPGWQGRGVAARLLRSAEFELQDRKCVRVTLYTSEPLKRATRFYLKNGYSRSGRVKDSFGMPLFEYVKPLP